MISLFTAVFPKCEWLGSGSFSKTQFSKQIHTQVSSIFENKGYHIFPRGIYERQEDAENSVSLFHMADLIKIASINALPN